MNAHKLNLLSLAGVIQILEMAPNYTGTGKDGAQDPGSPSTLLQDPACLWGSAAELPYSILLWCFWV